MLSSADPTFYELQVGAIVNLVLLDAPEWHQALQFQADKRLVVLRGQVVAETEGRSGPVV